MTLNHMADLVAQHSRKLIRSVRRFDQSAIHVDEPAWKCKGVHLVRVDDEEMPIEVGAARMLCDRVPTLVDVAGDVGIVHDGQLVLHLLSCLRTKRHLVVLRDLARGDRGERKGCGYS